MVVAKLRHKGIHPVHGRWEDFAQAPGNRMRFSLITMRAVRLEPRHLSILGNQTLDDDGLFAWWAGSESGEPGVETSPELVARDSCSYTLPGIDRPRSVLVWKRTGMRRVSAASEMENIAGR
ncbi:MAG: hypothetical protein ABFD97_18545 [Syntrophobacter sp.]